MRSRLAMNMSSPSSLPELSAVPQRGKAHITHVGEQRINRIRK
jgi:hypothetical protein